jgi:aminopeptidase-like protein
MLWTLNLSDGQHDLLDVAIRSGLSFDSICQAAYALQEAELLEATR